MGRLSVLTERYKKQKGNGDLPVKIVVSFLASQKGFEPPTLRLGGRPEQISDRYMMLKIPYKSRVFSIFAVQ